MLCKNCNKEISDDSSSCIFCDAPVDSRSPKNVAATKSYMNQNSKTSSVGNTNLKRYIPLILIGVIIVVGAFGLYKYYEKRNSAPTFDKTSIPSSPSSTPVDSYNPTNTNNDNNNSNQENTTQNNNTSLTPGIYPQASERLLTYSDISRLSKWQLKIIRNEIYARHGYIFKNNELKSYFNQQTWYTSRYDDVNSLFSEIEKENIEFIKKYE